ncbi:MAG: hypothetical protein IPN58_08050 [Anaerolineales bacterium]|nr:hypothetical protein [Anaerolineales bacterium]
MGPYIMHPAGDWLLVLRGEFSKLEHAFLDITNVVKSVSFTSRTLPWTA